MSDISRVYKSIKIKQTKTAAGIRIFDTIRKMYVEAKPEEIVRQKTITFIQSNLGVAADRIRIEEPVCHYGVENNRTRMDIVVHDIDNNPLLVIECKAPTIMVLAQQVIDQAIGYVKAINAKYFAVTNGNDIHFYAWHKNEYEHVDGIVSYTDMLEDNYELSSLFDFGDRFTYEQIWLEETVKNNRGWCEEILGEDTPPELYPAIINLDDCFLDSTHVVNKLISKRFKLIEDVGVQYRNYHDASGSTFGTGFYRILRIKDSLKNIEFTSGFGIMTTGKTINDPKFGNSSGKSVLVVMYHDGIRDETPVQINLNECMKKQGLDFEIIHNALIRKKGKSKKELLDYVSKFNAEIVADNEIKLSVLDCRELLYMDSPCIEKLLSNLIEYSYYRMCYKNK